MASSYTSGLGSNYEPRAGFDSSGASGLYHFARPDYPTEAVDAILSATKTSARHHPLTLLEVGSGTGIFTQCLLEGAARRLQRGCSEGAAGQIQRYLAVEPSKGMRKGWDRYIFQELVAKLASKGLFTSEQDIACVEGTFENLSSALADGKTGIYDLVMIAQAWHWCPNIPASLNGIAGALKSPGADIAGGGHLALIWNMEDQSAETGARWVSKVQALLEKHEDNTPQHRHRYWASMYKQPSLLEQFEVLEPKYYTRKLPATLQGVKDRVLSKSYISVLMPEEKAALLKSIDDIFASEADAALQRTWIDKERGIFEYPISTGEHRDRPRFARQSLTGSTAC